jgi:hypothetical protein
MKKPKISIPAINGALADVLAKLLPGVTVRDNPSQQNAALPSVHIIYMPHSGIRKQVGGRHIRKLFADLVYLDDFNLTDLFNRYTKVAEILDANLETFPVTQDGVTFFLRTHERTWAVELSALHYKFHLELHTSISAPDDEPFMETMKLIQKLKGVNDNDGA